MAGVGIDGGRGGLGGRGGVEFGEVFGGGFLELADAHLAAEPHEAVGFAVFFVDVVDGFTHGAEGFVGDDAGRQRVDGGCGRFGGGVETGDREAEDEEGGEKRFHTQSATSAEMVSLG